MAPRSYSDYGLRARVARLRASYRAALKRFREVSFAAQYARDAGTLRRLAAAERRHDQVMREYEDYSDELARREHFVGTTARAQRAALMLAYKYHHER